MADLIVDVGLLRGSTLTWVSSATAPFRGEPPRAGRTPGRPDRAGKLPFPNVMQFRVSAAATPDPFVLPARHSDVRPLTHGDIPDTDHQHRVVALVERGGELQLCETVPLGTMAPFARMGSLVPGGNTLAGTVLPVKEQHGYPTYHAVLATRFDETINWHVKHGLWEVWKILNLPEDMHPFHVHVVQFQALRRDDFYVDGWNADMGMTTKPLHGKRAAPIDDNELGLKDTIRVSPGQMVTIAARFDGGTGRYMYHCHILEHEDHDMMRAFVAAPLAVVALTDMPGMPGMDGMGMGGQTGDCGGCSSTHDHHCC